MIGGSAGVHGVESQVLLLGQCRGENRRLMAWSRPERGSSPTSSWGVCVQAVCGRRRGVGGERRRRILPISTPSLESQLL